MFEKSTEPLATLDLARGSFTLSSTDHSTSTVTASGNQVTGANTSTSVQTDTSNSTQIGGNSQTTYTHVETGNSSVTETASGNDVTGARTATTTASDSGTATEVAVSTTTNYTLVQTQDDTGTDVELSNAVTGAYTLTTDDSSDLTMLESGFEGTVGQYDLTKTTASLASSTNTGNDVTGSYDLSGTTATESTAIETTNDQSQRATFTEILTESATVAESGNSVTGNYTLSTSGTDTADFNDVGTVPTGTFTVTEWSTASFDRSTVGNAVSGDYTQTDVSQTTYSFTQSLAGAAPFTLSESGLDAFTTAQSGNDVTGDYTLGTTGSDTYTLMESGVADGGSFAATVTGVDNYTVTESGNTSQQVCQRTTIGDGTYDREISGSEATLGSLLGTNGYTVVEVGDDRAGHFQEQTDGTTRYGLLPLFADVSNTTSGASPGNVSFYSHGLPFRDPAPQPWDEATGHETVMGILAWMYDNDPGGAGRDWVLGKLGHSPSEVRQTSLEVFTGLWDRAWGLTGGLFELLAPRDPDTGKINWMEWALMGNGGPKWDLNDNSKAYTKLEHIAKKKYEDYLHNGLEPWEARMMTAFTMLPIASSGVKLAELYLGKSLQAEDWEEDLPESRNILNRVDIVLDLLPWLKVKAGRGGRGAAPIPRGGVPAPRGPKPAPIPRDAPPPAPAPIPEGGAPPAPGAPRPPIAPGQGPKPPLGQGPNAPGQAPRPQGQGPNAPGQGPNAPGQVPNAPGQGPNAPGQAPNAPGQAPRPQAPNAPGQGPNAPGQGPRPQGQGPTPFSPIAPGQAQLPQGTRQGAKLTPNQQAGPSAPNQGPQVSQGQHDAQAPSLLAESVHGRLPLLTSPTHAGGMLDRLANPGCFSGDTLLCTPSGLVRIDQVSPGMLLLSRDESDPEGPIEAKEVEQLFVREGLITLLRVQGRTIRSTAEHPFFVRGAGWMPLNQIRGGDLIWTEADRWVPVEAVEDTGEWETVHNVRITEHHTYFVGTEEWDFAVWAHNTNGICAAVTHEAVYNLVRHYVSSVVEALNRKMELNGRPRVADLREHTIRAVVAMAQSGRGDARREVSTLLDEGNPHSERSNFLTPIKDRIWLLARWPQQFLSLTPENDPLMHETYDQALARMYGRKENHHVFTNENWKQVAEHLGYKQPFSVLFLGLVKELSPRAQQNWLDTDGRLSLDVDGNIVPVFGHRGPHEAYDHLVYQTMVRNLANKIPGSIEYDMTFEETHKWIKDQTRTPGTRFHELVTQQFKRNYNVK